MSPTATLPAPSASPPPIRWTCDQFHAASDAGVFEGRNAILVDGEILEMPAPNPPHNSGVELVCMALRPAFGNGYWIRGQTALDLSLDIDPVPDVAVILGSPRTVITQPTTALLVIEVADTTLATDLGLKSHLYAQANILDYWVLVLNNLCLHVFRNPIADPTALRGYRYSSVQVLSQTQTITPVALPSAAIPISELLP
jgi:Uma2 family endonuclease